jgi:hypothetical protein
MIQDTDLPHASKIDKLMTIDIEVTLRIATTKASAGRIRETDTKANEETLETLRIAKVAVNKEVTMAKDTTAIVETIAETTIMAETKASPQDEGLQASNEATS